MVQFMSSEENNVGQFPEPEAKSSAWEDHRMYSEETEEDEPLPKRWKPSSSQTTNQYNPLGEPSPLGLRLRKSPSLLKLAQKRLNQGNTDKGALPTGNLEGGTKRVLRARARARTMVRARGQPLGSIDKLKASHFPALLLRIGQWEYVSKHEGDLVAKRYFSKHKIVWEVLDGGLKKKFEINWADIMALKANSADDGIGTLTIVLDKQPLFFKEINPQPKRHTQWQATSDFTNGEASTHRQHFLQCAQGVLDKHYEKLIQCDTQLNLLSQQQDTVWDFPYFAAKTSLKDQDISGNNGSNSPEMYSITHMASPSTLQTYSSKRVESSALALFHQDMPKEAHFTNSVMSRHAEGQKDIKQLKTPSLQPTISMSDLVNHIGNDLSEQKTSGDLPFLDNVSGQENPKDMLENISQILLSDSHFTAASDEKTLMSRVDSLCRLLQDYQECQGDADERSTPDPNLMPLQDGNVNSTPDSRLMPQKRNQEDGNLCLSRKFPQGYPNGQQDGNEGSNPESNTHEGKNVSGFNQESGISRKDSFADLLHQLPRIASLPKFLFEISEDGKILR